MLTAADVETNDNDATGDQTGFTYALSGDHGALFATVNGRLQLRDDATPLSAGDIYNVIVTVTDSDGGSYSETFNIVQGGLYVEVGGQRSYSNGGGLIDEGADGSGGAVTLGVLGVEGTPAEAQNISYTLVAGAGDRDNADFAIAPDGTLTYTGTDSGDYDIPTGGRDSLQIRVQSDYQLTRAHSTDFTGQTGVDASGDTADADTRTFAYEGGTITQTDVAAVDAVDAVAGVDAVASSADIGGLSFTADTAGTGGDAISVSVTADSNLDGQDPLVAIAVTGTTVAITYGTGATLQNVLDAITASSGTANDAAALVDAVLAADDTGDDAVTDVSATNLAGGVDAVTAVEAVEADTAHRTVDVAGGTIYVDNGDTAQTVTFAAVTGLRVEEAATLIVDDSDGDGTYDVRAVTELPTEGDFYVLGTVEPLTVPAVPEVPAVAASGVSGDLTFTADTAGAAGNAISVEVVQAQATAAGLTHNGLVFTAKNAGTGGNDITVSITHDVNVPQGSPVAPATVTGNDIVIRFTDQGPTVQGADIAAAIEGSAEASALVAVAVQTNEPFAGHAALDATNLSGGAASPLPAASAVISAGGTSSAAIRITANDPGVDGNNIRIAFTSGTPNLDNRVTVVTDDTTGITTITILQAGPGSANTDVMVAWINDDS